MATYWNLTDAKNKLSELVDEVHTTHEEVVVTRNGRPVAVVIAFDELDAIRETMEILSNPAMMAQIRETEEAYDRGEYAQPVAKEDLLGEIRAAAEARRAQGLPA